MKKEFKILGLSIIIGILLVNTVELFGSCLGFGGGVSVPKFAKKTGIYIVTDIKPSSRLEESKIKSVAVLKFDAKNVKTVSGDLVDYIYLSNKFSSDLIKKFYVLGKIDVALGEYEDKVIETDLLTRKRGDIEVDENSLNRSIQYKCTPYKKIESILGGTVNKYQEGDDWAHSFIDITLRLTDTYSGAVYWVTDMRGYVKDVVETIVRTISERKYTEPMTLKQKKAAAKKKEKKISAEKKKAEEAKKTEEKKADKKSTKKSKKKKK